MTSLSVKPHLLRADTIDLQSQQSPSAKDHSRGPYNGYINVSQSNTGLHHAQALRNANQDAYQERHTSPRLGGFDATAVGHSGDNHMYDDGEEDDEDHMHSNTNGHHHPDDGYEDGDGNDSLDEDMDDELLDKISSSPSIEDEDIDFEFVYALHTFVATVEGQANATKGDTMVLLDDTNSYWWLVRVVKDGSIGYLPAEHIETPTERLARLNKHRNIDLSASMLGDNPEKSKNPLKKAMRRRNAKTVNFAPPTYYEPEEREWSDEEDGDDGDEGMMSQIETNRDESAQTQQGGQSHTVQQAKPVVEQQQQQRVEPRAAIAHRVSGEEARLETEEPSSPVKSDVQKPAPLQVTTQDSGTKVRQNLMRNTDSFFKDDSVETKKISLTPRLLRGDNDSAGSSTVIEPETKPRPSLESADRASSDEKGKDGKKKEKKGMLSGLFKRKDKGAKSGKSEADEPDRVSEDLVRPSKDATEGDTTPERKLGKLQKTPPSTMSPKHSPIEAKTLPRDLGSSTAPQEQLEPLQPDNVSHGSSLETTPSTDTSQHLSVSQSNPGRFPSLNEKRSVFAPITEALRSKNAGQDNSEPHVKAVYSKRAKSRFALEDSDSDEAVTPTAQSSILHRSISPPDAHDQSPAQVESDRTVSPLNSHYHQSPPINNGHVVEAAEAHTPTLAEAKIEPSQHITSDTINTSPSERTASTSKHSPSVATHTPSTSRSTPTWSDASLRSYMDNDQDIRDLLVIVHDKSNVQPVGADHPLMNGLFSQERSKLTDMQTQLDTMLMTWLAKKNPTITSKG